MAPTGLDILTVPQRQDNYAYLLMCSQTRTCAVVDPSEADPVMKAVESVGGTLDCIFNTHFHQDHTGANIPLKDRTGCRVMGGDNRIWGLDVGLKDGDIIPIGQGCAKVLETPGHTVADISFYVEHPGAVFTGDCLFSMGCGRVMEGTMAQMWASLKRLRDLPGGTRVFPGHNYTLANIAFAKTIDPNNSVLQELERLILAGGLIPPSSMDFECQNNPFLRADDPQVQSLMHMDGAPPDAVFAALRTRKDGFIPQGTPA